MKFYFSKLLPPRSTFLKDMTPAEGKLMQEHAAYLRGFASQGTAIIFGPVADPKGAYGICVWELPDNADIHAICAADPVVKAGLGFSVEIQPMLSATGRK